MACAAAQSEGHFAGYLSGVTVGRVNHKPLVARPQRGLCAESRHASFPERRFAEGPFPRSVFEGKLLGGGMPGIRGSKVSLKIAKPTIITSGTPCNKDVLLSAGFGTIPGIALRAMGRAVGLFMVASVLTGRCKAGAYLRRPETARQSTIPSRGPDGVYTHQGGVAARPMAVRPAVAHRGP